MRCAAAVQIKICTPRYRLSHRLLIPERGGSGSETTTYKRVFLFMNIRKLGQGTFPGESPNTDRGRHALQVCVCVCVCSYVSLYYTLVSTCVCVYMWAHQVKRKSYAHT